LDGAMALEAEITKTAEILKKCSLFEAVDELGRRQLAERAHRRSYAAGEKIFTYHTPGQSMMAVLSGTVRISRPTHKGKEVTLDEIRPGQLMGEIALLDGGERSADAAAMTRCELLILDRRDVLPFLADHPRVCLSLLELICRRLRNADERMSDIGFADLSVRLAKALLSYSGAVTRAGKRALPLRQGELAGMIGASRSSVNRQLRKWQRRGIVALPTGGGVVILNPEAVKDLSGTA
jgi:CRP/FNR family cyclic AMP-dependent transcriptional regulator